MRSFTTIECSEDYASLFKELFCVAAQDLANLIQQPLENIGVLFEGIMTTGTVRKVARRYNFRKSTPRNNFDGGLEDQIEAAEKGRANIYFGRGQLLFVVRRVSRADSTHIQSMGYRFASMLNVLETLARSMQVTREELLPYLENLQKYAGNERILEPGVHVACFALRPLFQRGFEVAVRRDARNLLPTNPLPLSRLERSHTDILNHMDNWTVAMCCDWLRVKSSTATEQPFYRQFLECITKLAEQIEKPFFLEARLIAQPFKIPCRMSSASVALHHARVITFRTIVDAYHRTTINESFMFAPCRFFLCQQHVYRNSPDHAAFARRIHRELAALAHKDDRSANSTPRKSVQHPPLAHPEYDRLESASTSANKGWFFPGRPSGSMTRGQGNYFDRRDSVISGQNLSFGGINVSREIIIDVSDTERGAPSCDIDMASMGVRSEAGVAVLDPETFADQLMTLTTAERRLTQPENDYRPD